LIPSQNNKIKTYVFSIVIVTVLYVSESLIPKPFPWIRIGFSNIVFMLLLKQKKLNLPEIYLILLFRNIIASVIAGTAGIAVFAISLISSGGAIFIMYLMFRILRESASFLSVSVAGAMTNMFLQLLTGSLIIFQNTGLLLMSRYFLLFAFVSGLLTGYISNKLYAKLSEKKFFIFK